MSYKDPFVRLTEEKLISDLETSRKQIKWKALIDNPAKNYGISQ